MRRRNSNRKSSKFWWINNGREYEKNREKGYLWTLEYNRIGRINPTRARVRNIRKGDILFHYVGGWIIKAISSAQTHCYESFDIDSAGARRKGLRVDLHFYDIEEIYLRDVIDECADDLMVSIPDYKPFYQKSGHRLIPNQGFLFNFSFEAAEIISKIAKVDFPVEVQKYFVR